MAAANEEIYSQAAEWAAKRNSRALTGAEQAEFDAWLKADVRHLGAYGRAEAVLERLSRIPASALTETGSGAEAVDSWSRRRVVLTGGIAASVAAAVTGGAIWRNQTSGTYTTDIGQVREIALNDGSVMTLNTNSKVVVKYTPEQRLIHLVRGEALFDVAKNKKRPFIVTAGDTKVRAVGTSFVVSLLPQRPIEVIVKEGVIELDRATVQKFTPTRVSANKRILASDKVPFVAVDVPQVKIERETAWQFGRIALDNQTLQDASEIFARYSDTRLVVDPSVSNRTVTGMFVANDPIAFAKAAAAVLDLQVEVADGQVKLFDKSDTGRVGKI